MKANKEGFTNSESDDELNGFRDLKTIIDRVFSDQKRVAKKNVTIYISEESIEKLSELSEKHKISKSVLIEEIIDLIYQTDRPNK